jgi:hypothetical protein
VCLALRAFDSFLHQLTNDLRDRAEFSVGE